MKKYIRFTYYSAVVLLFLLVALAGYTQTSAFREYLRTTLLKNAHEIVHGEIWVDSIEGNLLTGFQLKNLVFIEQNNAVISAENAHLKYDPIAVFFKQIGIADAKIINPTIVLIRSHDGTWNIDRLFRSAHPDSTPSPWTIDIKNVELVNAKVEVIDSCALSHRTNAPPPQCIDYARVRVDSLTLRASLFIAHHRYEVTLRSFECSTVLPAIRISQLKGVFSVRESGISAKGVEIALPHSQIHFSASLLNTNIFKHLTLEELRDNPVELRFHATPLAMDELKQFLYPYVDFLSGVAELHVDCKGKFGDFKVNECRILSGKSKLSLTGSVMNLHTPSTLQLNVSTREMSLHPSLTHELLAGLSLPDLDYLGFVAGDIEFDGTPQKFHTTLLTTTSLGTVKADARLSFETNPFTYEGIIQLGQFDIGPLVGAAVGVSSLNGSITVNGAGANPRSMATVLKAEIDSSLLYNIPITNTVIVGNIADGLLNSHLILYAGSGRYELSSKILFSSEATSYSVQGKVISCNLAELLHDRRYESSLSFTIHAGGNQREQQSIDSLTIAFYPSSYGQRSFENGRLVLQHKEENGVRSIDLESEPLELHCVGTYTLPTLVEGMKHSVRLYGGYFSEYLLKFEDSTAKATLRRGRDFQAVPDQEVKFHVECRDLSAIGTFFSIPLEGEMTLHGILQVENDSLMCDVEIQSPAFELIHGSSYGEMKYVQSSLTLRAPSAGNDFNKIFLSTHLQAQSLSYNHSFVEQTTIRLVANGDSGVVQISGVIDSLATITVENRWLRRGKYLACTLPVFSCTFDSVYDIQARSPIECLVSSDGIWIDKLKLEHDTASLTLRGIFNPSAMSDLRFDVDRFSLGDLKYFRNRSHRTGAITLLNGVARCRGIIRGTLDNPSLVANGTVENGSMQDVFFGTAVASVSYYENRLYTTLSVFTTGNEQQATPDLFLRGTIPYKLQLTAKKDDRPVEGNLFVEVQGEAINAILISPFLPIVQNVSGSISCNLKIEGDINSPQYSGFVTFKNVQFLFRPLGIQYILNGQAVSEGDHIRLQNITLRNVPEDRRPDGVMNISGTLTLSGLSLKSFSLRADGELLLLKEQRMPGLTLYGTLYVATSPQGITWQGTSEKSLLRGELYLLDAQLIFPPEREVAPLRASTISITFVDDTVKTREVKQGRKLQINGYDQQQVLTRTEESFLNKIDYDLVIETRGTSSIRFVFNTQTSEELFAVLKGRLTYNKVSSMSRFIGQVEVGERSYYNFFKKFDATGTITFTGELSNPELNVTARYEGIHVVDTSTAGVRTQSSSSFQTDRERIAVILKVTGTRNEPKVSTRLERYENNEWVRYETGDDESNAISFILSGQFTDELTAQQRTSLIGTNLGFGLAAGMITGPLSEALRRNTAGYIQSVDVLYYGGQFDKSADVRLTGQVGEAIIRFGGKVINDPFGNANVSVELPLSVLSRNLILSLEHKVESFEYSEMQRRAYNSAKIFYRFTF